MKRKNLFTIILGFIGGTYIAQCSASSPEEALTQWLADLQEDALALWKISRQELQSIIEEEAIVPIEGCANVWCIMGTARMGIALINIITTLEESSKKPKIKVVESAIATKP